jgi:hypothetical protein
MKFPCLAQWRKMIIFLYLYLKGGKSNEIEYFCK